MSSTRRIIVVVGNGSDDYCILLLLTGGWLTIVSAFEDVEFSLSFLLCANQYHRMVQAHRPSNKAEKKREKTSKSTNGHWSAISVIHLFFVGSVGNNGQIQTIFLRRASRMVNAAVYFVFLNLDPLAILVL